jgi:tRNA1(Val) A37 N6-methylase TrmN6
MKKQNEETNLSLVTSTHTTHFKGWAKPGPVPSGMAGTPSTAAARNVGVQALACSGDTLKRELQHAGTVPGVPLEVEPHETLDAISGHFRLFQLRAGHRFSTDDILTAWYGTTWCPTARTALDLGSGIGTVGMICAWRLSGAKFVTVEAQSDSVALAKKTARYNGVADRYEIREGDFRAPEILRAGEKFDLITGSPPYFPPDAGVKSEHPQKLACRFELRGTVADYCTTAAKHLAPGGFFACVFPHEPVQLARVEAGAREAGLVIVRKRPVVFREGDPPLIALFGLMRASDLPEWFRGQTWTEPDLIIRTRDRKIHPEYSAVKLAIGFPP